MKKIIALILAVIMTFSLCTVAFAEGETETTAPDTSDVVDGGEGEAEAEPEAEGDFDWLLDLPFWTVGPAFKFAKIALKLVKVVVKLGMIFGLVDATDIIGQITDMINGAQNGEAEETTTVAPEVETTATTEPVIA